MVGLFLHLSVNLNSSIGIVRGEIMQGGPQWMRISAWYNQAKKIVKLVDQQIFKDTQSCGQVQEPVIFNSS